MLAQLVDLFGQTGLAVLYGVFWACPLLGLGFGTWLSGRAYAGQWWPILFVYYLLCFAPVLVGWDARHPLFFCCGILIGPLIGVGLAVGGLLQYLERSPSCPACAASVCGKCGYDLTGNTSGVCPECGEPKEMLTTESQRHGEEND